jgi:hypothetical protein
VARLAVLLPALGILDSKRYIGQVLHTTARGQGHITHSESKNFLDSVFSSIEKKTESLFFFEPFLPHVWDSVFFRAEIFGLL